MGSVKHSAERQHNRAMNCTHTAGALGIQAVGVGLDGLDSVS